MNDDHELTEEQLRLATSRALVEGAKLDAETAALREGFIALGSALESATGRFDEMGLIERLTASSHDVEDACELRSKSELVSRNWWTMVLSGALAAAALVAVIRIAIESRENVATVGPSQPALSAPEQEDATLTSLAEAWNDPLDDEIALAAETIGQLASRHRDFDDSLSEINQRLEALSMELGSESL